MKIQSAQIINKPFITIVLLTCCCMVLSSFKPKPRAVRPQKKTVLSKPTSPKLELDSAQAVSQNSVMLDSLGDTPAIPPLPKPRVLNPLPLASPDPLAPLDQLVIKQFVQSNPYVPLVQEISIGLECIGLLKDAWIALKNIKTSNPNQSYEYAGSLAILFRNSIQLSTEGGYAKLYPENIQGNRYKYKVMGFYGSLGLDYLSRYSETDNLYAGLRYSRAYFTNHTLPDRADVQVISQKLTASWFELVLGAESRLVDKLNLYGGFTIRVGYLNNFGKFSPAKNYVIPGYGLNANKFRPVLNLYILYKLSFIERMIKLT